MTDRRKSRERQNVNSKVKGKEMERMEQKREKEN